jgi:protein phosphatase
MPVRNGMGTTLVALLSGPTEYLVANVGDSRAYRVEDGGIRQITADHSFASEAIGKGMSQEEVDASPWRNALTRAIGPDPDVEVDVFGPFSTAERHRICLCTDGLYRVLSDERIKNVVSASVDVDGSAKRLADLAYAEGSSDNITVAVVGVGDGRADAHEAPSPEASTFQAPSDSETPPSPGAEASTASESHGRAEPPADALSSPATDESSPAHVRSGGVVSGSLDDRKASRRRGSIGEALGWIRWRHRRFVRLSQKRRLEVWGTAITILLAAVAAYMVLNVL